MGDLDQVVMKALEKECGRRYQTADGLARDIERYLNDEPVEAQEPSPAYKLRKFAHKHRVALTVAAGFAVVLVAGTAVSTWEAFRANHQRDRAVNAEADANIQKDLAIAERKRADEESSIAKAINEFLNSYLLRQANPMEQADPNRPPDRNLTVREALDRAATQVGRRFSGKPRIEMGIRSTIGNAYRELAEFAQAQQQLETVLTLARALPRNTRETVRAMDNLAAVYDEQGRFDLAEPLLKQACEQARGAYGEEDADTLAAMSSLAAFYNLRGRPHDAEILLRQVLETNKRTGNLEPLEFVEDLSGLATAYRDQGRFADALPLFEQALQSSRTLLGPDNLLTLKRLDGLATIYRELGRATAAEPFFQEVLSGRRKALGEDHPDTIISVVQLATTYADEGRLTEAEPQGHRIFFAGYV